MVLLCRLVVRGYDQVIEDTGDTFASTPSLTTLKLLLTLSIAFGWRISTLDISATFLHALITGEDIFLFHHLTFTHMAVYSGNFVVHFMDCVTHLGFGRTTSNEWRVIQTWTFTIQRNNSKKLYVLCYVDDLMVSARFCGWFWCFSTCSRFGKGLVGENRGWTFWR